MLCADEPELVDGLLLLSYPLHAPSWPDRPRIQHLPSLKTPALFVHGTRDPFGSIEEMQSALKLIPAKTKLLPVNNAGHELRLDRKSTRLNSSHITISYAVFCLKKKKKKRITKN